MTGGPLAFRAAIAGSFVYLDQIAVDIHEGEKIDEKAFKALVRAAAGLNTSKRVKGIAKSAK